MHSGHCTNDLVVIDISEVEWSLLIFSRDGDGGLKELFGVTHPQAIQDVYDPLSLAKTNYGFGRKHSKNFLYLI